LRVAVSLAPSRLVTAGTQISTSGTLMKKIQCQLNVVADEAADDRPQRRAEQGGGRRQQDRLAPLFAGEGAQQQGLRKRHQKAAAKPLADAAER
jgi:hypothetical protein